MTLSWPLKSGATPSRVSPLKLPVVESGTRPAHTISATVRDDGPAATDLEVIHTRSWMIYELRSIKRFGEDNKMLNTGADVCNGGIEQVGLVLQEHC